jgi:hypothetical protein
MSGISVLAVRSSRKTTLPELMYVLTSFSPSWLKSCFEFEHLDFIVSANVDAPEQRNVDHLFIPGCLINLL